MSPLRAGGLFHFKKDHAAYSITAEDYEAMPLFVSLKENRLLNTNQSLCAFKFLSADPAFVKETVKCIYPLIPATATAAPEMPATRAFSR
jgi:hypothetical protein